MRTINDQFDEYRDCLRLVWNYALRHRLKGSVSIPDVSQALLGALVLDDLSGATVANTSRTGGHFQGAGPAKGYIPGLGVVVSIPSPLVRQPEERATEIIWNTVGGTDQMKGFILYYVDVFDFRDADQMFDLEYVKAVASADFGKIKRGGLVLLPRSEVDIVDLTAPEPDTPASFGALP